MTASVEFCVQAHKFDIKSTHVERLPDSFSTLRNKHKQVAERGSERTKLREGVLGRSLMIIVRLEPTALHIMNTARSVRGCHIGDRIFGVKIRTERSPADSSDEDGRRGVRRLLSARSSRFDDPYIDYSQALVELSVKR